jgi:fused signal recognition particle receptor
MRFWRRPAPGPVPGPDPGADAVAEDTENRKPEEEVAVADLHPAPSPEPDATEEVSADEAPSASNADRQERGLWSGGFWRGAEPAPHPEQAESSEPLEPATVEAAPPQIPSASTEAQERRGWFARLKTGMARSSERLNTGINTIFNRRRLDDAALLELEELLIASDMGLGIAAEVTEELRRSRFNQEVSPEEVRAALAEQVIRLVEPVMKPLRLDLARKPFVILVVGVNGSGKTTTIAKLAKQYRDAGHDVMLAAGDTFRAAGVEQLQIWGERTGCRVISRPPGSDAAGLAFEAFEQARAEGSGILLIDTAGRLHNKANLMSELQKIVRVLKKVDPQAPHSVLLVLDATTGQNAHAQAEIFREMVGVTGIVMTKLDGTARGGVLVSLAEKYGIPIHAIGIGETADDLRPFEARAYARSLVGLDP